MSEKSAKGIFGDIRRRFDDSMTEYLRNNTTDQEILDYYGDGRIVGRKGINPNPRQYLREFLDGQKDITGARPSSRRVIPEGTDLMGLPGQEIRLMDLEGSPSPETGRPWQMRFETLPFPTEGQKTVAADRFLNDFRVPKNTAVDYGFETSPNLEDYKEFSRQDVLNDGYAYKDSRAAFKAISRGEKPEGELRDHTFERLDEINKTKMTPTRWSGKMSVPSDWQERGYPIPENVRSETIDTFRSEVLKQEKPFGSVSQLTPVMEHPDSTRPGGKTDWRANLYEKLGLAGPQTEVSVQGAYGPQSATVQMFTRGNEGILPIQPHSEFLDPYSLNQSAPSAVGGKPAPDFTQLQKQMGTRNYLIGKHLLEGRGRLGGAVRGGVLGAPLEILDPEVAHAVGRGDYTSAGLRTAGNSIVSTGVGVGLGAAFPALMTNPVTGIAAAAYGLTEVPEAVTAFRAGRNKVSIDQQKKTDREEDVAQFQDVMGPDATWTQSGPRTKSPTLGNELRYAGNSLMSGEIPYLNIKLPWAR